MVGYLHTRSMRADCPECQRDISGGWAGDPEHRYIVLRRHKAPACPGRPQPGWCTGGRRRVQAQRRPSGEPR